MRRLLVLCFAVSLASGCALRPRYRDLAPELPGQALRLRLLDRESGAPVAGAHVLMGEGSSRVTTVTGADGAFELPPSKRFFDDNSLLVVELPVGVKAYRVASMSAMEAPPPAPPVEPAVAPAPPAEPPPSPAPTEEAPKTN